MVFNTNLIISSSSFLDFSLCNLFGQPNIPYSPPLPFPGPLFPPPPFPSLYPPPPSYYPSSPLYPPPSPYYPSPSYSFPIINTSITDSVPNSIFGWIQNLIASKKTNNVVFQPYPYAIPSPYAVPIKVIFFPQINSF